MVTARAQLADALARRNIGDPNGAVAEARDAESIFIQSGDRDAAASALNTIGNVLSDQGDSAGGKKHFFCQFAR
jgi:hypothetical protein